jgi:hypothetical protein
MAAFIPSRDPQVNEVALDRVRADKRREAGDGFDGSWVAHPGLVDTCRQEFDAVLGDRPHQLDRLRDDVAVTAADLLAVDKTPGQVTAAGLRSNIAVARIILGFGRKRWTSGFVEIPLELRDPFGLAALACIITSTPGTLWVNFNEGSGTLTIHVLDLVDKAEWARIIKGRYERLLLEIFA